MIVTLVENLALPVLWMGFPALFSAIDLETAPRTEELLAAKLARKSGHPQRLWRSLEVIVMAIESGNLGVGQLE